MTNLKIKNKQGGREELKLFEQTSIQIILNNGNKVSIWVIRTCIYVLHFLQGGWGVESMPSWFMN